MANLSFSYNPMPTQSHSIYFSSIFSTFFYYVHQYWEEEGDPRVKHLPLMNGGPILMLAILGSYLIIVKNIGPNLMKNRDPFQLRKQMLIYNIFMVLVNAYFFCEALLCLRFGADLAIFSKPTYSDLSHKQMRILHSGYYYYLTKYADLIETFIFILRKKHSQVSGLHLYHHTVVPLLGWFSIKLIPTATPLGVFVILNSIIHVFMYLYYGLSAFDSNKHKYFWWKKYLTQIQLFQFVIYALYGCVFLWCQTGYPSWLSYIVNNL
jgi:hypothetical protein